MTVRVTLPPTMHRAEVYIVTGVEHNSNLYMFWRAVEVDPSITDVDAVERKLQAYRELDGYHYERFGNIFELPPVYKFTHVATLEEES